MQTITFKRGDTFSMLNTLADEDITGWTIASQVRRHDGYLIDTLVPSIIDGPSGQYSLESSGSTDGWPVGAAVFDIQYTDTSGLIVSTETVSLVIQEDVTHG